MDFQTPLLNHLTMLSPCQVCLKSCANPSLGAWFYACPIILLFHMAFDIFGTTLHAILLKIMKN